MSDVAGAVELAEVLKGLGLRVRIDTAIGDEGVDAVLELDGARVPIEVKARATVTPQQVANLAHSPGRAGVVNVVVADRVVQAARASLQAAGWGWFDRRGHVHLAARGVFIDAMVPRRSSPNRTSDPLSGRVAKEVASWVLAHPHEPIAIRPMARNLGRSASAVSQAVTGLRSVGLVTQAHTPLVPELFWELATRWPTKKTALSRKPGPGDRGLSERLGLGLEDVEHTTGWALADTLAAAAYGAPVGARSDTPPDFLVPSATVERLATMMLGGTPYQERACTVRSSPVQWACDRRVDGVLHGAATHWPLAHPVVVALDLAGDPDRGREVLDAWNPPHPWVRVW